MVTNGSEKAGHPVAIRVGGRRLSQSQQPPFKNSNKGGTSPDDNAVSTSPTMGDYPRPDHNTVKPEAGTNGGHEDQQQEESSRRKKRGLKNDEAKNMLLNNTGSASGRAPRRSAAGANGATGGARIQQPSRGLAL